MKYIFILFLISFLSCSNQEKKQLKTIKKDNLIQKKTEEKLFEKGDLRYELIREFDHDQNSYTQGYFYKDSILFESSGGYGKSKLMKIDPTNGEILKEKKLPLSIFAEGIELIGDKIYMLTWRSGICNIYDLELNFLTQLRYSGEGWGICTDGNYIYTSDGSNIVKVRNIDDFSVVKELVIYDDMGNILKDINELEFVGGEIFANIWLEDKIIRFDPENGEYRGKIDLSQLRQRLVNNPEAEALNGIAFDRKSEEFYLTGKNWNKVFVMKFFY